MPWSATPRPRPSNRKTALHSRVLLGQAKGIVAEAAQLDMDAALHLLRNYARNHNRRLTDTAEHRLPALSGDGR